MDGRSRPEHLCELRFVRATHRNKRGELIEAIKDYEMAIPVDAEHVASRIEYARILARSADDKIRGGKRAQEIATRACELTHGTDADALDALASACAELRQFDEAMTHAKQALKFAHDPVKSAEIKRRMELYQSKKPCRE